MYRGIFWIVDEDNLEDNNRFLFKIKTEINGAILDYDLPLNARNGNNYAHKATWNQLPTKLKHNKSFDYYPRGRVEIKEGLCKIYINPSLNSKKVIDYLIREFELEQFNEIEIIEDYSTHYKAQKYINNNEEK